jgi:hypothetical protein
MIARFRCLLPFKTHLVQDSLAPFEWRVGDHRTRIWPPYKVRAYDHRRPVVDDLDPSPEQLDPDVSLDGQPTIGADAFQLDFLDCEPDRTPDAVDPRVEIAFALAAQLFDRLRGLGHCWTVRPPDATDSFWTLRYLADDESALEASPNLVRGRGRATYQLEARTLLLPEIWRALSIQCPTSGTTASESLLLDATALLSQVGPSLVLAHTAIESRIATALDHLAAMHPDKVAPDLWHWIVSGREPEYLKRPSIREQLDKLMRCLGGRSLKDESRLWEAFARLNKARNSFVHTGKARIDENEINVGIASELVGKAREIVQWIEAALPEEHRQERISVSERKLVVTESLGPRPVTGA